MIKVGGSWNKEQGRGSCHGYDRMAQPVMGSSPVNLHRS